MNTSNPHEKWRTAKEKIFRTVQIRSYNWENGKVKNILMVEKKRRGSQPRKRRSLSEEAFR